ncbi:MAG: NUDIX hydrolase, partial [Deltaproteobacteria bacterium]
MPENWKILSTRRDDGYRVFSIRTDRAVSPRTGAAHDFFIL